MCYSWRCKGSSVLNSKLSLTNIPFLILSTVHSNIYLLKMKVSQICCWVWSAQLIMLNFMVNNSTLPVNHGGPLTPICCLYANVTQPYWHKFKALPHFLLLINVYNIIFQQLLIFYSLQDISHRKDVPMGFLLPISTPISVFYGSPSQLISHPHCIAYLFA